MGVRGVGKGFIIPLSSGCWSEWAIMDWQGPQRLSELKKDQLVTCVSLQVILDNSTINDRRFNCVHQDVSKLQRAAFFVNVHVRSKCCQKLSVKLE